MFFRTSSPEFSEHGQPRMARANQLGRILLEGPGRYGLASLSCIDKYGRTPVAPALSYQTFEAVRLGCVEPSWTMHSRDEMDCLGSASRLASKRPLGPWSYTVRRPGRTQMEIYCVRARVLGEAPEHQGKQEVCVYVWRVNDGWLLCLGDAWRSALSQ